MMRVQATFSLPDGTSEDSRSRQNVQGEALVFAARRVAKNRFLLQLRFTRLSLPRPPSLSNSLSTARQPPDRAPE